MTVQEESFVRRFVAKDKQQRYIGFLLTDKTRHKFIEQLYHFKHLYWKLFGEIQGNENERHHLDKNNKKEALVLFQKAKELDPKTDSVDEFIRQTSNL